MAARVVACGHIHDLNSSSKNSKGNFFNIVFLCLTTTTKLLFINPGMLPHMLLMSSHKLNEYFPNPIGLFNRCKCYCVLLYATGVHFLNVRLDVDR